MENTQMLAEAKHRLRRASISYTCSHHHFLLPYLQYKSGDTLNDSNIILANRETAEQFLNIHTVQENFFGSIELFTAIFRLMDMILISSHVYLYRHSYQ